MECPLGVLTSASERILKCCLFEGVLPGRSLETLLPRSLVMVRVEVLAEVLLSWAEEQIAGCLPALDWCCCYSSVLPCGCVGTPPQKKRTGGILTLGVSLAGFFEPSGSAFPASCTILAQSLLSCICCATKRDTPSGQTLKSVTVRSRREDRSTALTIAGTASAAADCGGTFQHPWCSKACLGRISLQRQRVVG